MKKRMLSLLLILCMAVTLLPTAALAAQDGSTAASAAAEGQTEAENSLALLEDENGGPAAVASVEIQIKDDLQTDPTKGYTVETKEDVPGADKNGYGNTKKTVHTLTINKAGSYHLTQVNGAGTWRIVVAAEGNDTVELTLSGLTLDLSKTGYTKTYSGATPKTAVGVPALEITGGCETVITLEGTNTLKGGVNCAGLQNGTYPVTINGSESDSLEAVGGIRGAGIGGGVNANGGNITINGGNVTATGGLSAAGIGGGYDNQWNGGTYKPTPDVGNGFNITISGGTVTARGTNMAAGIGGGGSGDGYNITINGGKVTATGGATGNNAGGAGIGGGWGGSASNIEISGSGTTVTVEGKAGSADIGAGNGGTEAGSSNHPGTASNITVSDGTNVKKSDGNDANIGFSASGVPFLVIDENGNSTTHYSKEANVSSVITDGVTVKLLCNVELKDTESITVNEGKNFTLDLNGFTISQKKEQTNGHSLLTNNGTLTIKDSSAAGTGKITYEDTGSGSGTSYTSNTITNKGTLTLESGTIENTCSTHTPHNGLPYAIDNQSGSSTASLTITGGTVDCKAYSAIRLFCNSTANTNSATISGGTIRGCVEYQQPIGANDKALGSLTIKGGNFERNEANMVRSLYIFSYKSDRDCSGMTCTISGGTFEGAVEVNQYAKGFNDKFITGGIYKNGQYENVNGETKTFMNDPSRYVVGNETARIVKRDGNTPENYVYTVLAKENLTDGVYLSDPTSALAPNYYVSSTEGRVWTVRYSAPSSGSDDSDPTYAIEADKDIQNGEVTVSRRYAEAGDTVTITVKPDSGYVLGSLTVTDKNGDALKLTDKGDGKYTFTMPAGKVEVTAVFTGNNPFTDVPAGSYYEDAVIWAVGKGITTGTSATTFSPDGICTRAQAVTFLWRAAGSPAPTSTAMPFTDVPAGSYYYSAVLWAIENGITKGTSDTTFSPDADCTRAQIVTFLYRYEQSQGKGFTGEWMFQLPFTDVPEWCYEAVAWCYMEKVTDGTTATTFSPDTNCTRAQIVTFLYRCMK